MSFISDLNNIRLKYEIHNRTSIIDRYAEVRGNLDNRPVFSMLWQCYAWAAILGFIHNRSRPLKGTTDSAFPLSTVYSNGSLVHKALVCAALAKAEEGVEILRNPKTLATIIEEYANGGFDFIAEELEEKGPTYFDDFTNMLMEVISRDEVESNFV